MQTDGRPAQSQKETNMNVYMTIYRLLFSDGLAYRGRHWYDLAEWLKAKAKKD